MPASTLITDYMGVGLASARPAGPSLGTGVLGVYYATDTKVLSAWDGTSWTTVGGGTAGVGYGMARPPFSRPALGSFTWTNQGTATATDWANGPLTIQGLGAGAGVNTWRGLGMAVPGAAPWTLTAELGNGSYPGQDPGVGVYVYDGTKLTWFGNQTNGGAKTTIANFTNVTTWNSAPLDILARTATRWWWRINNDGTNLNFYNSENGADWALVYSALVGSWLGAITLAGFGMLVASPITTTNIASLYSWEFVTGAGSNATFGT